MKLFKEEKINKELSKELQYDFEVEESGIYLIEITARAKNWWQNLKNLRSFFNDDDLAVIIDNISFPKLNSKKGLFDSEMSWNGNQLKGLLKTNIFILYFEKGRHNILFINDKNPFLKKINIFQIENDTEKSHKNWYWCGKILQGKEEEFDKDLKLEKNIHYIELYTDGSPTLNKIEVDISRKNLGEIPTVDNPKWTGDWNDDTEQMILARMILGEGENQSKEAKTGIGFTVLNRIKKHKEHWGLNVHEVILKESQYDSFWNENTRDKVRDPFSNKISKPVWNECYEVSKAVLGKRTTDTTFGATHFHTYKKKSDFPDWATEKNFKIKINRVYFYELEA